MRRELHQMEKIDQYLNGKMLPEEVLAFEAEMAKDPALKSQVETQALLIQSVRRKALSKTINQVAAQQDKTGYSKWLLSLFVLVIASLIIVFWPKPIETTEMAKAVSDQREESGFVFRLDTSNEYAVNEPVAAVIDESVPVEVTQVEEAEKHEMPEGRAFEQDKIQENEKDKVLPVQNAPIRDTVVQVTDRPAVDQDEVVDVEPVFNRPASFPGGKAALRTHIESFLIQARSRKKEGVIYIDFVIEKDGSIHDVQVIEGVSRKMNAQAVKMVESMPNWEPAIKDGVPVSTPYRLPIILARR